MGYSERKRFRRTLSEVRSLMKSIAKKEKVKLVFMAADNGVGGYNYGAYGIDCMLSPFVKAKKGEKVNGYTIFEDCDNPVECMLITFFHELAHAKLTDKVPSIVNRYTWNDTSKFQFELWITMLGIEYAHKNYGIKFSDQAVRWLINVNMSYIVEPKDAKEPGYGLICTKATSKSYEVLSQWEFRGHKKVLKKSKKSKSKEAR